MVNTVKSFSISLRNLLHIPANLLQKQQKELGIQMVVNLEINLEGLNQEVLQVLSQVKQKI